MGLNKQQKMAVVYNGDKHLILIAGAGSGKTHVLKLRTMHLVNSGVNPRSIIVLSFTKKSSREIKGRISSALGSTARGLRCSTFHRFCLDIMIGTPQVFGDRKVIIDMDDQERLMGLARADVIDSVQSMFPTSKELIFLFSYIRNTGKKASEYLTQYRKVDKSEIVDYYRVFKKFTDLKRKHKYLDFDDILHRLSKALNEVSFCNALANRYSHILVDEFQDTNHLQWTILNKLIHSKNPPQLYCVGDSAQCHPAGTQIAMTGGTYKHIEDVVVGDNVVSYIDRQGNRPVYFTGLYKPDVFVEEVGSRKYKGSMMTINAGGKSTPCTPNHKWYTRFSGKNGYCIFLIRKEDVFQVGYSELFYDHVNVRRIGPVYATTLELADSCWILYVFSTKSAAQSTVKEIEVEYGIPIIKFVVPSSDEEYAHTTTVCESGRHSIINAVRCLYDHGLSTEYPLFKNNGNYYTGTFTTQAQNLIPEYMGVHTFNEYGPHSGTWYAVSSVDTKQVDEMVYSLKVSRLGSYRLYVANGLLTHNSIFGFRGSDYKNILNFCDTVPGSTSINLNVNYRSYQEILDISNWMLSKSDIKYDKRLVSDRGNSGILPKLLVFATEEQEAQYVAADILRRGGHFSKFMVLSRTGFGAKAFEHVFINNKIPHVLVGGKSVLDSAHIKDLLSMGRAVESVNDTIGWSRFLCLWPKLGITTANRLVSAISACNGHTEALKVLMDAGKGHIASAVREARRSTNPTVIMSSCLSTLTPLFEKKYKRSWAGRSKSFDFMFKMMVKYTSLSRFIEVYTLDPVSKKELEDIDNRVQIMTVHAAKGSERDICYVSKVQPGSFPHSRSVGYEELEEERRLLYVALTRAKDELIMTRVTNKYTDGQDFMDGIPRDLYKVR